MLEFYRVSRDLLPRSLRHGSAIARHERCIHGYLKGSRVTTTEKRIAYWLLNNSVVLQLGHKKPKPDFNSYLLRKMIARVSQTWDPGILTSQQLQTLYHSLPRPAPWWFLKGVSIQISACQFVRVIIFRNIGTKVVHLLLKLELIQGTASYKLYIFSKMF